MAPNRLLKKIAAALSQRESRFFSPLATHHRNAVRRIADTQLEKGYRQAFSVDTDRILHSLAYTRYIDKTQVFYLIPNDHITHRVLHVQLVSKIARTIGRFLGLNEDLIEAIALGHDIGHTPFGHDGERILSELCQSQGIGYFMHNVQSVHFLEKVERKGRGWNLCLQTLDGILCHDGEIHNQQLKPNVKNTFGELDSQIALKKSDPDTVLIPMTLEGCVVRMTDTISYIGRDIEDAIRLGFIKRSDLPRQCVETLGNTNGTIIYNLVSDVICQSYQQPYVEFSQEVSSALNRLKTFNLERIYLNPKIKPHLKTIKSLFNLLFERFLNDLKYHNAESVIFTHFLDGISLEYLECNQHAEIVRDFIAGMTDQYFLRQCPEDMRPKPFAE